MSVIEIMPVAEFPGRFGWGYDGVSLFAPSHLYGTPDDLRAFVDCAHAHGIGVILDVVYNHLGPDGNYLKEFSKHYFKGNTEWGEALNFDGDESTSVREFFIANAGYWIEEFHLDGLRLDATQQIFDSSSKPHISPTIAARVREQRAAARSTIIVAENEPQNATLVRRRGAGGYELDALWNDDFHHAAMVALTGADEAYYSGYRGTRRSSSPPRSTAFSIKASGIAGRMAARRAGVRRSRRLQFINFIQNHDQVANSAFGVRVHRLDIAGRLSRDDGATAALAADADALPGAGISRVGALSLLRRSQSGSRGARPSRPRRVPRPIRARRDARDHCAPRRSRRSEATFDALQARLVRASSGRSRLPRWHSCAISSACAAWMSTLRGDRGCTILRIMTVAFSPRAIDGCGSQSSMRSFFAISATARAGSARRRQSRIATSKPEPLGRAARRPTQANGLAAQCGRRRIRCTAVAVHHLLDSDDGGWALPATVDDSARGRCRARAHAGTSSGNHRKGSPRTMESPI